MLRVDCYPKRTGLHYGHGAMSHTRPSFHCAIATFHFIFLEKHFFLNPKCKMSRLKSVQFHFHLFLSLIGAWTLKMPVPYPPPSVGAYTRTPSHQPLVFSRKGTDHLP